MEDGHRRRIENVGCTLMVFFLVFFLVSLAFECDTGWQRNCTSSPFSNRNPDPEAHFRASGILDGLALELQEATCTLTGEIKKERRRSLIVGGFVRTRTHTHTHTHPPYRSRRLDRHHLARPSSVPSEHKGGRGYVLSDSRITVCRDRPM